MGAVVLSMDLTVLTVVPDGLNCISCQTCGSSLNLHQPEADLPNRLLGTCDHCGVWYLIDGDRRLMLRLPPGNCFDAI